MPVLDIYSKRQKKIRGEYPDVYSYEDLTQSLRVQIIQILDTFFEGWESDFYESAVKSLRHEYGVFKLTEKAYTYKDELFNFFLSSQDIDQLLDVVETSFLYLDTNCRENTYLSKEIDNTIEELNYRFKEHGVGYQFCSPEIIRIDSEWIHTEVVKPALKLLEEKHFAGAREEFLKAHEYYRKNNSKDALTNCLKALESVMKAICDKRGWSYNKNATAKSLIKVCFENGLIPSFWDQNYSALRSLLESSVPTGRNKLGAHGQGTSPISVPNHLVAYMLHMTASAIVFLATAEQ